MKLLPITLLALSLLATGCLQLRKDNATVNLTVDTPFFGKVNFTRTNPTTNQTVTVTNNGSTVSVK